MNFANLQELHPNPHNIPLNVEWCCAKGCGKCLPVEGEFEYYKEETLDGKLIESRTEKIWVSDCCKVGLLLWDKNKHDFVEHDYATLEY